MDFELDLSSENMTSFLELEQDLAEEELEALADKNSQLQNKLVEMETEFKYLKKLMVEAGLGKYTQDVNY